MSFLEYIPRVLLIPSISPVSTFSVSPKSPHECRKKALAVEKYRNTNPTACAAVYTNMVNCCVRQGMWEVAYDGECALLPPRLMGLMGPMKPMDYHCGCLLLGQRLTNPLTTSSAGAYILLGRYMRSDERTYAVCIACLFKAQSPSSPAPSMASLVSVDTALDHTAPHPTTSCAPETPI